MLRQSDAQVFKKYSQMKLQMKREALVKLNRREKFLLREETGWQDNTCQFGRPVQPWLDSRVASARHGSARPGVGRSLKCRALSYPSQAPMKPKRVTL
jgi:hypothetical protein